MARIRQVLMLGVSFAGLPLLGSLAAVDGASAQSVAPGFDGAQLARNDDGSTGAIALPFAANFFGTTYSQLYVNNNGNVTFGQALGQYTPVGLGAGYRGAPIIAPFFADIDTRNAASGVTSYGTGTYAGQTAFGATWPAVGYYSNHADKTNTFQVIMASRPDTGSGNFDIYFNYARIQFETGDASGGTNGLGGTSASAGYSAGTGDPGTYFELPGSLVNGAFLDGGPNALATGSNNGVPGQFLFPVRGGSVLFASVCQAGDNASTTAVANCGPNQAYTGGIFYTPANTFTLNVLDNTTISAGSRPAAILVMPTSLTEGNPAGDVTINVAASAAVSAPAGIGIQVDNQQGTGTTTITSAGTITAGAAGILSQSGAGAQVITNAGQITAANVGIAASATQGAVTVVNSGQVAAPVGLAANSGSGTVSVTNRGAVGNATVGIAAASNGQVSVANETSDSQIIFGKYGIAAAGAVTTVTNAGTIAQSAALPTQLTQAQLGALPSQFQQVASTTDTTTAGIVAVGAASLVITNTGLIDTPSGVAINTLPSIAAAQVSNAGTINGSLLLNTKSTFANQQGGVFNASGVSTFGGGALTNAGQITLSPGSAFTGLASLGNLAGGTLAATDSNVEVGALTNAGSVQLAGTVGFSNLSSFRNLAGGAVTVSGVTSLGGGALSNAGGIALGAGAALNDVATFDNQGVVATAGASSFGVQSFNNAGIVTLGGNTSISGAFTNSGTLQAARGGAVAISTGAFTNSGLVNLQNGLAGDTLTVNGNYVGRGGQVSLDVSTQNGASDRLVVTGNATGTTRLNLLNLTPGAAFTTSPTVVQVAGQRDANA
ncbi:nidogen-like domain-containing protein, partial [Methylobacterium crusticola]